MARYSTQYTQDRYTSLGDADRDNNYRSFNRYGGRRNQWQGSNDNWNSGSSDWDDADRYYGRDYGGRFDSGYGIANRDYDREMRYGRSGLQSKREDRSAGNWQYGSDEDDDNRYGDNRYGNRNESDYDTSVDSNRRYASRYRDRASNQGRYMDDNRRYNTRNSRDYGDFDNDRVYGRNTGYDDDRDRW